jgi:acyl-CoA synthetase (AMP-forming)/AMP-acid ligase II
MPEETANTFKNGWLYTGDLARMDQDGYLYIVERKISLFAEDLIYIPVMLRKYYIGIQQYKKPR